MEAVRRQLDALGTSVSDLFARFGWPVALAVLVAWWAWVQFLGPWWRVEANMRAIRWVGGC